MIIGDYAFPEGLQDDPVYSIGRKVIVCVDICVPTGKYNEDGNPIYGERWETKVCLGCRIYYRQISYGNGDKKPYRIIYFDDGTLFDEGGDFHQAPKIVDDCLPIGQAMNKLVDLLMGKENGSLELRFPDGRVVSVKQRIEALSRYL